MPRNSVIPYLKRERATPAVYPRFRFHVQLTAFWLSVEPCFGSPFTNGPLKLTFTWDIEKIKEIKPLANWDLEKLAKRSKSTFTKGGKIQRDKTFSGLGL
jgi:hypothetical protein